MDGDRLKSLVKRYKTNKRQKCQDEGDYYRKMPSLRIAINNAATGIGANGKRHRHQWRLDEQVLKQVANCLVKREDEIAACKDFDSLMRLIESCRIRGFGELAIYDTALRIGARLGLSPDKVYLHRGTLIGARRLGLDVSRGYLMPEELPAPVQVLTPDEIEDFLCIYKEKFD